MGMYSAYFDAAGSFNPKYPDNTKIAVVVSGYVASVDRWLKFEKKWNAVLAEAGITVPFHMAEFMANQAPHFSCWAGRDTEKVALLMTLARLIRKHVSRGIGQAVLIDDWKRVNQVYAMEGNHCTPFAIAGFFVIDKTMRWIGNHHDKGIKTAILFEDGDMGKVDLVWAMEQIHKAEPMLIPSELPNFGKKDLVPFQACDLVAWLIRSEFGKRLRHPVEEYPGTSKPLEEMYKLDRDWGYQDYDSLIKFCERFDVPKVGEDRLWDGYGASSSPPKPDVDHP